MKIKKIKSKEKSSIITMKAAYYQTHYHNGQDLELIRNLITGHISH